jgi:transcriptional regulator GlxA family with amidase domain
MQITIENASTAHHSPPALLTAERFGLAERRGPVAGTALTQRAAERPVTRSSGGLAPWQQRRVTEYMEAHLAEHLCLSLLAQIVRLSATHFSRAFKQSTRVSPHKWLINLRCERAQAMLLEPTLGVADIAMATGFSDQAHFTRVFGRVVGTPPAAWRRAQLSNRLAPVLGTQRRAGSRTPQTVENRLSVPQIRCVVPFGEAIVDRP